MKKITRSIALTTLLLSGSTLFADSWNVTQVTSITGTGAATVGQHANTSNSLQGMNVINTAGLVVGSQEINANALTFQQTDTVSASTQAANYAKADVLGMSSAFLQKINTAGLTLDQSTSGSNVVQGGNVIGESASDLNVDQNITDNATLTMTQTGTDSALQVGNGVLTSSAGSINPTSNTIMQYVSVGGLDMDQNGVSNSVQAANYVGPAQ